MPHFEGGQIRETDRAALWQLYGSGGEGKWGGLEPGDLLGVNYSHSFSGYEAPLP